VLQGKNRRKNKTAIPQSTAKKFDFQKTCIKKNEKCIISNQCSTTVFDMEI